MSDDVVNSDSGEAEFGETEDVMFTVVATWFGAVLGLLVLVLMALSGVMVDSQR
ncbi:hypothetical protein [Umezawaea sp.]|uniref:hypothetical protein n=1 Tax=Umezawaea sp. TaxID=1955258 RepID=UPI002ED4D262